MYMLRHAAMGLVVFVFNIYWTDCADISGPLRLNFSAIIRPKFSMLHLQHGSFSFIFSISLLTHNINSIFCFP